MIERWWWLKAPGLARTERLRQRPKKRKVPISAALSQRGGAGLANRPPAYK